MVRFRVLHVVVSVMLGFGALGVIVPAAGAQDATPTAENCGLLCEAKKKAEGVDVPAVDVSSIEVPAFGMPGWLAMPEGMQAIIDNLIVQARQSGADGQALINDAVMAATYCTAAIRAGGPDSFAGAADQVVAAQDELDATRTVIAGLQATPLGGVPVVAEAMSVTAFLLALLTNDQFIAVLEGDGISTEIPTDVQAACTPGEGS